MLTTIAISLPVALLSPVLVERLGRRPMFLISAMLLILQSVLLGASQSIVDMHRVPRYPPAVIFIWHYFQVNESPLAAILGILSMLSGSIASMAGVHGFTAILIAELCPPSTRVAVGQVVVENRTQLSYPLSRLSNSSSFSSKTLFSELDFSSPAFELCIAVSWWHTNNERCITPFFVPMWEFLAF